MLECTRHSPSRSPRLDLIQCRKRTGELTFDLYDEKRGREKAREDLRGGPTLHLPTTNRQPRKGREAPVDAARPPVAPARRLAPDDADIGDQ